MRCTGGHNRSTGQVHVQFFGEEREHGWVGDKWLMAYKGLAVFESEAELDSSMKVKPNRRAAWIVAVNAAEQAVRLERLERIHLLTYLYEPMPQKITSSPKKRKHSYRPKNTKMPSVGGDKSFMDISQDNVSPPQKKYRRRSSLPPKQDTDEVSDSHVPSDTTESYVLSSAAKNTNSSESESATRKSIKGKMVFFTGGSVVMG